MRRRGWSGSAAVAGKNSFAVEDSVLSAPRCGAGRRAGEDTDEDADEATDEDADEATDEATEAARGLTRGGGGGLRRALRIDYAVV